ncbi:tetratricopeptide repeat protein [Bacteroidales bacterium OttesenSCG-928-E04]|nr:tetratricopeptide repeat protein [Bacteroidales bacterium OttesenSCG-928-E04]
MKRNNKQRNIGEDTMKQRVIFAMFALLLASAQELSASDSLSNEQYFLQAAELYQQENYPQALTHYMDIVNGGNQGAILFYNIGNCYYKMNDKAQALLWYERALRLDPSNEDIKHNISFVNQTLIDKIETMPEFFIAKWWDNLSKSMTSNNWAIGSIAAACLFFLFLLLIFITRRRWIRSTSLLFSGIFCALFILTLLFARKEEMRYINNPEAIIMQSVAIAKSTPTPSGSDLFVIHEGLKVSITDKIGDWYEIKLPNGEKGWLEEESLEEI